MATNLTQGVGVAYAEFGLPKTHVNVVPVDFAQNNELTGQVVTVMRLPGGCFVQQVIVEVATVEGAVGTITVGDQDGAANWFASVDVNALSKAPSTLITTGKFFADDNPPVFSFTLNNDLDMALVKLYVLTWNVE